MLCEAARGSHLLFLFAVIITLLASFTLTECRELSDANVLSLIEPQCATQDVDESTIELENPNVFWGGMGTIRTYEGCLQRMRDRFVVVSSKRERSTPKPLPSCHGFQDQNKTLRLHYLASDLCRLGHTTKDAPHLLAFLLDYLSPCAVSCRQGVQRLRIHLTIVFGNACMSFPVQRLDKSFRRVILGWFHAVFRGNSPFITLLSSWGIDFVTDAVSSAPDSLRVSKIFFKDLLNKNGSFFCLTDSNQLEVPEMMRLLVRWERFRWFRTRFQANLFRLCLLRHYKVPVAPDRSRVLLLSRPNERRFDEKRWFNILVERLHPCGISVSLQDFSSIPYELQASLMHNSSILIASHGAGLVNMMLMRPGSVVVELFPHGFRYAMYQELAHLLDINYIAYESPIVWPQNCCKVMREDTVTNFTPPLENKQFRLSYGERKCKECDIWLSDADMDAIIHDALGYVSAKSRLRLQ